jgi:hypothetical protein
MSKRFSIGFTEKEYQTLMKLSEWYEDEMGISLSRCKLIKQLLFSHWKGIEQSQR